MQIYWILGLKTIFWNGTVQEKGHYSSSQSLGTNKDNSQLIVHLKAAILLVPREFE